RAGPVLEAQKVAIRPCSARERTPPGPSPVLEHQVVAMQPPRAQERIEVRRWGCGTRHAAGAVELVVRRYHEPAPVQATTRSSTVVTVASSASVLSITASA